VNMVVPALGGIEKGGQKPVRKGFEERLWCWDMTGSMGEPPTGNRGPIGQKETVKPVETTC